MNNLEFLNDLLGSVHWEPIAWGIPAVLAMGGLFALVPWLRKKAEQRRIKRAVKCLGVDVAHGVMLSDGVDGYVFVDHLVLTPESLRVVMVQKMGGAIFCGSNMDMWAQIDGNRSYKFSNPLPELEKAVVAVKSQVPDIEVGGTLLFDRRSSFPKGKPEQVLHIEELTTEGCEKAKTADESGKSAGVREAWKRVLSLSDVATSEHTPVLKALYEDKRERRRTSQGFVLLLLAALWAAWLGLM